MHTTRKTLSSRVGRIRPVAFSLFALATSQLAFGQAAAPAPEEKKADTAAVVTTTDKAPADNTVVLETFTVTSGFAGSLAQAAEMKQKQALITDVIAAEDIGKLPDISIAESLTRLPGVTTQRVNGRAQAIVIRGLNGNFSTTLLNGRQQVSTNAARSVEFDQYPAELLSSVVVYKSTDASLVGQGLAGTVDLQTVRPLSQSTRTVAANAFYEWNSLGAVNAGSKGHGTRETLSYVDQFNNGTLGIAIGYSHSDRPGQGYQWNAWGFPTTGAGEFVLGGAKPFVRTSEIKRDGTMAVIEYKPNDKFHSTIDVYYSDFQETQALRGIEIPLWWSSAQLQPGYTVDKGLVTKGTFNNVYGVVRNDYVKRNDHLFAGGWNIEMGDLQGWKTDVDLGYSRVFRRDLVLETYSGYASNQSGTPETLTYTIGKGEGGATFTHLLDYSNSSLMRLQNPQGWASDQFPGGQAGFIKGPFSRDLLGQYTLRTQHPMTNFFSRFEAGVTLNRRAKYELDLGPDGTEGYFLGFKNGATSAPLPKSIGTTDLSFIGMGKMYSYDPLALYNSGFYEQKPNLNPSLRANNFDVAEKVWTTYVKFDIDKKMGSTPVTGNIGGQLVNTEQSGSGVAVNGTTVTPITGKYKYTDFIPALNLNFQLSEQSVLRFSAARQLARQPMSDMRVANTYGYNQQLATSTDPFNGPWSANGGNIKLKPWLADSYDLSWEHYFKDRMGYWAVAVFDKELVSYTYNKTTLQSFVGYPTGLAPGTPGSVPAIFVGTNNTPSNGQGGYIRGAEFALSLPGEKFSSALKGFGFVGSVSFFKSSIQPDLGNPSQPLPGLSDKVANATFYYEAKSGFAARISARYRSDYRGDISTFGPRGVNYRNLQAETNIDAQISYSFKKGGLKGLTIIAQGYNLNNEPLFATDGPDSRRVQDYQSYGATYSVGASYKF